MCPDEGAHSNRDKDGERRFQGQDRNDERRDRFGMALAMCRPIARRLDGAIRGRFIECRRLARSVLIAGELVNQLIYGSLTL
jgi:hypothetical protein